MPSYTNSSDLEILTLCEELAQNVGFLGSLHAHILSYGGRVQSHCSPMVDLHCDSQGQGSLNRSSQDLYVKMHPDLFL